MSKYRFSKNKEYDANVIREMLEYLRNSMQVCKVFCDIELIDAKAIEEFADKVESGDII